jgi:hypothetical protein
VRGPVPWGWVTRVCRLKGAAAAVAWAIARQVYWRNTLTVTLPRLVLSGVGVDRHAARRALRAMERAGLVWVVQRQGASPRVTVLPAPPVPIRGDAQGQPVPRMRPVRGGDRRLHARWSRRSDVSRTPRG